VQSTQAKIVMEEGMHPTFSVPVFSLLRLPQPPSCYSSISIIAWRYVNKVHNTGKLLAHIKLDIHTH